MKNEPFKITKVLISKYAPGKVGGKVFKYSKKKSLLTPAELAFFNILLQVVGEIYFIAPQVHLASLFNCKIKAQNWRGAFSHINGKSVDFVLCDKVTYNPVLAIELDDASHDSDDRVMRDIEVERIFREANFPLLRIKHQSAYHPQTLINQINSVLQS